MAGAAVAMAVALAWNRELRWLAAMIADSFREPTTWTVTERNGRRWCDGDRAGAWRAPVIIGEVLSRSSVPWRRWAALVPMVALPSEVGAAIVSSCSSFTGGILGLGWSFRILRRRLLVDLCHGPLLQIVQLP